MTCLSFFRRRPRKIRLERDKRGKDGAIQIGRQSVGRVRHRWRAYNMADLGQIFTRLGEMFGGVGTAMAAGKTSGPVNYDLARQVASSSIGFIDAHRRPRTRRSPTRLADTWLDGATSLPAGAAGAGWSPTGSTTPSYLEAAVRSHGPANLHGLGVVAAGKAKSMAGPRCRSPARWAAPAFSSQLGQALGRLSREVLTSTDIGPLRRGWPQYCPAPSNRLPPDSSNRAADSDYP